MVTDKERREIVARLRRKEPSSFETVFDVFTEIGLAVNPKGGSFKTLPLQLADLIEPEPERTITPVLDKSSWYTWRCPECGQPINRADNYCSSCGVKVTPTPL